MDNEESTVEQTTVEETQEQTSEESVNDSEVEENSTDETDKGDLRVPLKEERTRRQELELLLNDPDFIRDKAAELGITQTEAMDRKEASNRGMTYADYKYYSELEKAQDKYPQLVKNEALQYSVTAYINKGMSPLKAADKVFSEINKETEELAKQKLEEKKQEEIKQEKAQNVDTSSTSSASDSEYERLVKESKSLDRKVQDRAMIKLLELKEKKRTERK